MPITDLSAQATEPDDLVFTSAHQLVDMIRAHTVSCREVLTAYLDRIERCNGALNAVVSLQDRDRLLAEAAERDDAVISGGTLGALHGLPIAVKDLANTKGIRTTFGSPIFRDFVPSFDSLVVARMKDAGCIVIGKTNVPEFGLGSHSFNPVFGTTLNAYDQTKSAGGSSGGAAVALATSMVPVADGGDFMGSLRNPAGFNNVFGFRPSQGRVPAWPVVDSFVAQLSTEGPMGRSVDDVAMLFDVQAGYDPRLPLSLNDGQRFEPKHLHAYDPGNTRVGWLGSLDGYLAMEPGVLQTCESALGRLEALGCRVETATLGMAPDAVWEAWLIWRRWLVSAGMAPHIRAGHRDLLKPEALWEYDQAQALTGAQTLEASQQRTAFYQSMLAMFDHYDVLVLPTAQVFPFPAEWRWPKEIDGRSMDTYHRWMEVVIYATFAGLPSISVPAGFGPTGLPMGVQLIGRPRGDLAVLRLAAAYEQTLADLRIGRATPLEARP